ncbi:MAG: YcaO-like family protein, partial [Myxococcales bacterium]|nr:YcaO-like family protein [Myxococcales bacterium]
MPTPKRFSRGTQRAVTPAQTLERISQFVEPMGITRVANATGLDHIGIPVFVVMRPNARSLSTSQGKGLSLTAARTSGLMESIECYHAERIDAPLRLNSYRELSLRHRVVDPGALPTIGISRFTPSTRLLWIEGRELSSDAPTYVPYELVHCDMTLPLPEGSGCFVLSSNGLASGNTLAEATSYGLCEVIERDAWAMWVAGGETKNHQRRVDLASIDAPLACQLLDRFEQAEMLVGVWDITTDIGVPTYATLLVDREQGPRVRPRAMGIGCHPSRDIALLRSLT